MNPPNWDSFSFEPSSSDPAGIYTYDLTLFWGGDSKPEAKITAQFTFEVQADSDSSTSITIDDPVIILIGTESDHIDFCELLLDLINGDYCDPNYTIKSIHWEKN